MELKLIKMKKLYLLIKTLILFSIVFSCVSVKELQGNRYVYKSKHRILEIYFKDSSTCIIENTFKCPDIAPDVKNIIFECNYFRKGDTIIINNKNPDESEGIYVDIPPQESVKCNFLNQKTERSFSIGPSYSTDYEKYGLVPNIKQDTLLIYKNVLILVKNDNEHRRNAIVLFKRRVSFN